VNRLNNRPRKRLGYRTPTEVFWGEYSGGLDTSGAALNTGLDNIAAFEFDDLRFKLTQATVPEPGTLGLFGMGFAVLVASRCRQRH